MAILTWCDEGHRRVGRCGEVSVGAVFPPSVAGRGWRWRLWVSTCVNPVNGVAANEARAKHAVEGRFFTFLEGANLMPRGGVQ